MWNWFIRKYSEINNRDMGKGDRTGKGAMQGWDFKPSLRGCSFHSIPQGNSGASAARCPIKGKGDWDLLPHTCPSLVKGWLWGLNSQALPALFAQKQSYVQQSEGSPCRKKSQRKQYTGKWNRFWGDVGRALTVPMQVFVRLLISTLTPVLGSIPRTFPANSF